MSINAFNRVTLSADQQLVLVFGHTDDKQFEPVRIEVAVIALSDDTKRLHGLVADPGGGAWHAELRQADLPAGIEPFTPDDQVLLVGLATDADENTELWGGLVQEGHHEVTAVTSPALKAPLGADTPTS